MLQILHLLMLLLKVLAGVFLIREDWKFRQVLVVWLGFYAATSYYWMKFFHNNLTYKISFLIALIIVLALQVFWFVKHKKAAFGKADLILFPICALSFSIQTLPMFFGLCGLLAIMLIKFQKVETAPFISIMIGAEWLLLCIWFF